MTPPLSIRIAQAIGLTGAAWLSGNIAALTLISVPALPHTQSTPTTLSRQWHTLFKLGRAQNPPVAAATASVFAYLAYAVPATRNLYGLAAALTFGMVPWTIVMMSATNGKLIAKAEERGKETVVGDEEVEGLLRKWTTLNGFRSLFPLAGAVVGFFAVLG